MSDSLLAAWLAGGREATPAAPPPEPSFGGFDPLPPGPPPGLTAPAPADDDALVRFPVIEEATRHLAEQRILAPGEVESVAQDAERAAFTVARVASEDALAKIQATLAEDIATGGTLRQFQARVDEAMAGTILSPAHLETIYRTNVATAYSQGLMRVLEHPLVEDEFPYLMYVATHDGRVREEHLALETLGLDGTGVYRRDDPVWKRFMPPWSYNCRCGIIPLSVEDAAAQGVSEAKAWLASGVPPVRPAHVKPPPFSPPPGWSTTSTIEARI